MRNSIRVVIAACLITLLSSYAGADHLPPIDPILPGTNHAHENHDGHDHSGLVFLDDFSNASFRGAKLTGAQFKPYDGIANVDFTAAIIVDAHFDGSNYPAAIYSHAVFHGTYFNEPYFYDSDFSGADFSGANLDEVTFINSTLRGANFHSDVWGNTDLSSGVLENVDLRDIDFHGLGMRFYMHGQIDMRGDNLRGAIFRTTDISEATDLSRAIFDATTIYDSQTIFPPGFDPVARGLTFVPEPGTLVLAAVGFAAMVMAAGRRRG